MPSGKRQVRPEIVRDIASSRRSGGKSVDGFKSKATESAKGRHRTVPDDPKMETVESFTEMSPRAITTLKPERRVLSTTAFTGSELLSQLERMLSTSDNELFMFAVLAYDLGIPMAVKMLIAAHSLNAETVASHERITNL